MKITLVISTCCLLFGCINKNTTHQSREKINFESIQKNNEVNLSTPQDSSIKIDSFIITDYYYLFGLGEELQTFINLDHLQSHEKKTFLVLSLDSAQAFFSFITTNTPPQWDGDAKEEMLYEITYWNVDDTSRIIALCSTRQTWVSEQSDSISFYVHDKKGINHIHFDPISWDLGRFIGHEYQGLFDKGIWYEPPVSIRLPQEKGEIEVSLSFHEYMDNQVAYQVFDSLGIEPKVLTFDPTFYYLHGKCRR